jgi:hypothetical protein
MDIIYKYQGYKPWYLILIYLNKINRSRFKNLVINFIVLRNKFLTISGKGLLNYLANYFANAPTEITSNIYLNIYAKRITFSKNKKHRDNGPH